MIQRPTIMIKVMEVLKNRKVVANELAKLMMLL